MPTEKKTQKYGLLVEQGVLSPTKPMLPPRKKYLVAIQTTPSKPSGSLDPSNCRSGAFLYPTTRKLDSFSFISIEDLIKRRESILRARPENSGYFAVFNRLETKPVLSIVIAHAPLWTIGTYKRKIGSNAQKTLELLKIKGFATDNQNALIVPVRTGHAAEHKRIFDFTDNTVIIDPKTTDILYAGEKAIKLYPALAEMVVHKAQHPSRAQIIQKNASLFRAMKQQQSAP